MSIDLLVLIICAAIAVAPFLVLAALKALPAALAFGRELLCGPKVAVLMACDKVEEAVAKIAGRPALWGGVALLVSVVVIITEAWDLLEPLTGVFTLVAAGIAVVQTRRARQAVYADNGDGSWVVALQVGRPISEAVKKQFGQVDVLVDVREVLNGEHTLSLPEHYEALSRAVYAALCAGQGKNIHLILSGPVALSFLVGQLAGLFHFQLTVYQYTPSAGSYAPMPRPTRAWLQHRE